MTSNITSEVAKHASTRDYLYIDKYIIYSLTRFYEIAIYEKIAMKDIFIMIFI